MIKNTVAELPLPTEEMAESCQRLQEELRNAKLDQEQIRTDLENAIERANIMAMKAEIANVELSQIINTSIDGMYLIYEDFTVKSKESILHCLPSLI